MDWGGGDIPALSAMNVDMGSINLEKETNFGSETLFERWMASGDVARGAVLITTEAPLGNVAQVPDERRYILSQRVLLMKPVRNRITGDFLAAVLSCPSFQHELHANSTGSTALGIKVDRLKALQVPVPSLETQAAIASRLERAHSQGRQLIERLSAQSSLLKERRQALITAAVTGRMDISSAA
jgi:type I restriction enzyme S subunit